MATASRDVMPGQVWAFTEHRSMADALGLPDSYIQDRIIEAQKTVFDRNARPSYRRLCAQVLRRWGLS